MYTYTCTCIYTYHSTYTYTHEFVRHNHNLNQRIGQCDRSLRGQHSWDTSVLKRIGLRLVSVSRPVSQLSWDTPFMRIPSKKNILSKTICTFKRFSEYHCYDTHHSWDTTFTWHNIMIFKLQILKRIFYPDMIYPSTGIRVHGLSSGQPSPSRTELAS